MGNSKKIEIGHLEFQSQKEACSYFRKILYKNTNNLNLSGFDFEDVSMLLLNHPRNVKKVGCSITEIFVGDDSYGKKCFHIRRKDGKTDNFSFIKCLKGEHKLFTLFSNACRKSVEPELSQFKIEYFDINSKEKDCVRCPETKEMISFNKSHIDHKSPMTFSKIVDDFRDSENIDIENIDYERNNVYGVKFKDKKLTELFQIWHNKNADLQIIKANQNLKKSYLGRIALRKNGHKLSR